MRNSDLDSWRAVRSRMAHESAGKYERTFEAEDAIHSKPTHEKKQDLPFPEKHGWSILPRGLLKKSLKYLSVKCDR